MVRGFADAAESIHTSSRLGVAYAVDLAHAISHGRVSFSPFLVYYGTLLRPDE